MLDTYCLLAGLLRILSPGLLLLIWHKKAGARFYPALIAYAVCLPAFTIGSAIRSGLSHENFISYYIGQGIIFGIMEEGTKYLVMAYLLTSYDSRKDAVTYGIGHSAYETISSGLTCIGLIGTGNAAPDILWVSPLFLIDGIASTTALTLLIFYGIRTGKTKRMLPIAILLHAVANASQGIFISSVSSVINILLLIGECYAAYRCWRALWEPDESFF